MRRGIFIIEIKNSMCSLVMIFGIQRRIIFWYLVLVFGFHIWRYRGRIWDINKTKLIFLLFYYRWFFYYWCSNALLRSRLVSLCIWIQYSQKKSHQVPIFSQFAPLELEILRKSYSGVIPNVGICIYAGLRF